MTTQTIHLLPLNTYSAGNYSGSAAVPVGVKRAAIRLYRDNWPDTGGNIVSFSLDVSFDGGSTWEFLASATAAGGEPNGIESKIGVLLKDDQNNQRRVRGTVQLGTDISTRVDLDLVS